MSRQQRIDIQYIRLHEEVLAKAIMTRHYEQQPQLKQAYTEQMHKQSIRDILYTFEFLGVAVESDNIQLFTNYLKWLKVLLVSYKWSVKTIVKNFEVMYEVLKEQGQLDEVIGEQLIHAKSLLTSTYYLEDIEDTIEQSDLSKAYLKALLDVDRVGATTIIMDAYDKLSMSIQEIYLTIIAPCMHRIGQLWQQNKITVAQEHYCSASTQWILTRLYAVLFGHQKERGEVFLGACVTGELHEIGSRMVADFFEMGGWRTYYLGANIPIQALIQFAVKHQADVIGISATMMGHVEKVKQTIEAIRKEAALEHIKVFVGGYIFNQAGDLWQYVGADGWGRDAQETYVAACNMLEQRVEDII